MVKHVGYPRCVSNSPFKLVHSPAEFQKWKVANPVKPKKKAEKKGD